MSEKGSAQPTLTGNDIAAADTFWFLDVSDTSTDDQSGPAGTWKRARFDQFLAIPVVLAGIQDLIDDAVALALANVVTSDVTTHYVGYGDTLPVSGNEGDQFDLVGPV